jgi:hypothetical protein
MIVSQRYTDVLVRIINTSGVFGFGRFVEVEALDRMRCFPVMGLAGPTCSAWVKKDHLTKHPDEGGR